MVDEIAVRLAMVDELPKWAIRFSWIRTVAGSRGASIAAPAMRQVRPRQSTPTAGGCVVIV
jgi:hypothetical protein